MYCDCSIYIVIGNYLIKVYRHESRKLVLTSAPRFLVITFYSEKTVYWRISIVLILLGTILFSYNYFNSLYVHDISRKLHTLCAEQGNCG